MSQPLKWVDTFWGSVRVPGRTSEKCASGLAYIAWKGGVYEDDFYADFRRWFRKFAARHPDLAMVHVPKIYPVDEFRFIGEYKEHV